MKQKDLAVIAVIVFMSAIISYFVSNKLFAGQKGRLQAQVVQPISDNFPTADTRYFNDQAFDPTKLITIGKSDNSDPFGSQSQ